MYQSRCHAPTADFNPRSRTGSDVSVILKNPVYCGISTHAPAQGATLKGWGHVLQPVFQPTLPHRERPCVGFPCKPLRINFNPRSRTGSDPALISCSKAAPLISTHAPAQGATKFSDTKIITPVFQPTLPHRERRDHLVPENSTKIFQPTLPHRERQDNSSLYRRELLFQPTLPHRERQSSITICITRH